MDVHDHHDLHDNRLYNNLLHAIIMVWPIIMKMAYYKGSDYYPTYYHTNHDNRDNIIKCWLGIDDAPIAIHAVDGSCTHISLLGALP